MSHVHAELVFLVLPKHQHFAPTFRILHDEVLDGSDRDSPVEVQAELAQTLAVLWVSRPKVGDLLSIFAYVEYFV